MCLRQCDQSPQRSIGVILPQIDSSIFYMLPPDIKTVDQYHLLFCFESPPDNRVSGNWSRVLLGKWPVTQLLQNFKTFHGTQMFTTVFTRAFHLAYSDPYRTSPYHSILSPKDSFKYYPPTYIGVLLVVSTLLAFPTNPRLTALSPPMCATSPFYLIVLDVIMLHKISSPCKSLPCVLHNLCYPREIQCLILSLYTKEVLQALYL